MPVFNRRGEAVYGRGLALIAISGVAQAMATGGGPVWLSDDLVLFNRQQPGDVWDTAIYQPASGTVAHLTDAANDRMAGAGKFSLFASSRGYWDSMQNAGPYAPLAVDDTTGDIAVCAHRDSGSGLTVFTADGATVVVHTGALDSLEACSRGGTLAYTAGGEVRFWRRDGQAPAPIRNGLRGVRHSGGWRVGFSDAHAATVVHRIGEAHGYIVSRGHQDFVPDICAMPDGRVLFASCTGAGELPHEFKLVTLDTAVHERIELVAASPVPAPVPPSSTPVPVTSGWLRPWPRPIWVVPYQSFNAVKYGDTTDFIGNAALVIRESGNQTTADVQAHARRVASMGYPLVIQPEAYTADIAALVVALYVHASSVDVLQGDVQAIERDIAAGTLPDVPVICYLDAKAWPETVPAGLQPERHWLSPQLYRDGGEPLEAFVARGEAELAKLSGWGFRLIPTWHAYDRNGQGTEAEALEVQPALMTWGAAFRLIGFMPFSDMRRGTLPDGRAIGGMERYPALKAAIRSMAQMNPEGRPNRYSYWTPRRADANAVLRNVLGQDRELVQLSAAQKARLVSLLSGTAAPPVVAPPQAPAPDGPVPFENVELLNGPADVFSWPVTSSITKATCGGGQLCIDHTKRGQWPVVRFFDTEGTIEGNQYVFACIKGRWYGGANEWVRPGQECKAVDRHAIGADAFNREPLHSWVPTNGEVIGVMMSTPARAYPAMKTLDERSNVVFLEWRD